MTDRTRPDICQVEPASSTGGAHRRRLHTIARPCGYYVLSRVAVLFAALGARWFTPKLHLLGALTTGWDSALVHPDRSTRVSEPHRQRGPRQSMGLLSCLAPHDPRRGPGNPFVLRPGHPGSVLCPRAYLGNRLVVSSPEVFGTVVADRAVPPVCLFSDRLRVELGVLRGPLHHGHVEPACSHSCAAIGLRPHFLPHSAVSPRTSVLYSLPVLSSPRGTRSWRITRFVHWQRR